MPHDHIEEVPDEGPTIHLGLPWTLRGMDHQFELSSVIACHFSTGVIRGGDDI